MRNAIALILVLAMALTFCACGKDNSQTPTTPEATPTPEAVNTPAPQESEAPADEPESTPDAAPEATPEEPAAPAENIREEGTNSSGNRYVNEYSGETGELLKTEFYFGDGAIESILYYENEEPTLEVVYRPDGQIDCEYYLENDEVTQIVFYNYDAEGNLIDTTTEDMSWQGGDEGSGYNDVDVQELSTTNVVTKCFEFSSRNAKISSSLLPSACILPAISACSPPPIEIDFVLKVFNFLSGYFSLRVFIAVFIYSNVPLNLSEK